MNLYTLLDSRPFSTIRQVRGLLGQGTRMTHLVEIKFSCCPFRILSTQLQWYVVISIILIVKGCWGTTCYIISTMSYLLKFYTVKQLSQELQSPTKCLHHLHISNMQILGEKSVFFFVFFWDGSVLLYRYFAIHLKTPVVKILKCLSCFILQKYFQMCCHNIRNVV